MYQVSLNQPLPSYTDIWEREQRPAWVAKALAWMRAEYRRSTERVHVRHQPAAC
jgi:hypothetical protein